MENDDGDVLLDSRPAGGVRSPDFHRDGGVEPMTRWEVAAGIGILVLAISLGASMILLAVAFATWLV